MAELEKTALERLREFLSVRPDATNAEAAEAMQVSRQRISQICKKSGIVLAKEYPAARRRSKAKPVPRVITGGVQGPVNHTVCGSISELLVAADLMARGYKPYMPVVKQRSHDIVAANGAGEIITVEVRSGRARADGAGYTWQSKSAGEMRSQYYAIVITGEAVIYKPDLPPP